MAFIALMAGALFYAARIPVENPVPVASGPSGANPDEPIFPSFQLPDMDGVEHDFSEWHGKHRLLNICATWCAPCRREIPELKAFQDRYGDDGVQVIGIAVDFPEQVRAYAVSAEFNYPILVGEQDAMAVAESSGIDFIAMPFTMIVAADGELLSAYLGELHAEHLDHIISVFAQLDAGVIDNAGARQSLDQL